MHGLPYHKSRGQSGEPLGFPVREHAQLERPQSSVPLPRQGGISHEQIMYPPWIQTREGAIWGPRALLLADTTDASLSSYEATQGPGPSGWGKKGRAFFVHTVLAMDGNEQQPVGYLSLPDTF
jgi:hypothetical protein